NVARAAGKSATFLPKPIFEENGSGMHVHQSLWKGGNTLMFDENGYALLSDLALGYVAGLLAHGRPLMAFCAPAPNSYRRLVPGEPSDRDLYELSDEELARIVNVPGSLAESMDALEADHEFLLDGGVFTPDLIEEWISYKRAEATEIDLRPHPWEFVQSY